MVGQVFVPLVLTERDTRLGGERPFPHLTYNLENTCRQPRTLVLDHPLIAYRAIE